MAPVEHLAELKTEEKESRWHCTCLSEGTEKRLQRDNSLLLIAADCGQCSRLSNINQIGKQLWQLEPAKAETGR